MSTKLRAAVESTIEKRHAAGAAPCPPLDLDRFFAFMMNLLRGAPSHIFRIKPLRRQ